MQHPPSRAISSNADDSNWRMNSNSKICTFAHVTSVYFATSKVIKEAEILQEGFSLIFGSSDIWSDAAIVQCIFVGANSNIQFVLRFSSF